MRRLDHARWQELAKSVDIAAQAADHWFQRISVLYSEPIRQYHNSQHINECLAEFDRSRGVSENAVAVEYAIWFHDAVYEPRAGDNEEQSAALAREFLVHTPLDALVTELILATKHSFLPGSDDAKLIVDIDLAILGQAPARFWEYETQIRAEYDFVPEPVFSAKRAENLRAFLDRPTIYHTDRFRVRYQDSARANLAASVARLSKSPEAD